jgi:hypothetical protein
MKTDEACSSETLLTNYRLQGATTQKIAIKVFTAEEASNLSIFILICATKQLRNLVNVKEI